MYIVGIIVSRAEIWKNCDTVMIGLLNPMLCAKS